MKIRQTWSYLSFINMCVYMYVYIYKYVCIYISTYVHIYMICVYIDMRLYIHISYMYTHTCVCIFMYAYVYTYIYIHVFVFMCIYMYVYTCIHTQQQGNTSDQRTTRSKCGAVSHWRERWRREWGSGRGCFVCDMTHSCVWHDPFMCVARFIPMCDMNHAHVVGIEEVEEVDVCVTWLIHACGMVHSCVWHDSSTCVMWRQEWGSGCAL